MHDYFNQGRWAKLKNTYDHIEKKGNVSVLFGDSMTENFDRFMPENDSLVNMGISGDFSEGLIKRFSNISRIQPDNIFIMIGINDIIEKISIEEIETNYIELLELIEKKCPNTKIYIQSTLPTVNRNGILNSSEDINIRVQELNKKLKALALRKKLIFIDMYASFADKNNLLKENFTTDGIHLNKKGYKIWESYIERFL